MTDKEAKQRIKELSAEVKRAVSNIKEQVDGNGVFVLVTDKGGEGSELHGCFRGNKIRATARFLVSLDIDNLDDLTASYLLAQEMKKNMIDKSKYSI